MYTLYLRLVLLEFAGGCSLFLFPDFHRDTFQLLCFLSCLQVINIPSLFWLTTHTKAWNQSQCPLHSQFGFFPALISPCVFSNSGALTPKLVTYFFWVNLNTHHLECLWQDEKNHTVLLFQKRILWLILHWFSYLQWENVFGILLLVSHLLHSIGPSIISKFNLVLVFFTFLLQNRWSPHEELVIRLIRVNWHCGVERHVT